MKNISRGVGAALKVGGGGAHLAPAEGLLHYRGSGGMLPKTRVSEMPLPALYKEIHRVLKVTKCHKCLHT